MMYLLDVNVLIAMAIRQHEFHQRVLRWMAADNVCEVATCSITELGFVRVLTQAPLYRFSVIESRSMLLRMLASPRLNHVFLADNNDCTRLPNWVSSPKQITDGHLLGLSKAYGAQLATLDQKIPGAKLVP